MRHCDHRATDFSGPSLRDMGEADPKTLASEAMVLVELDPQSVVKGVYAEDCLMADGASPIGRVREKCPHCGDVSLQLVLRYRSVIWSHFYCGKCMRCFDGLLSDGRSALNPMALAID